MSQVFYANTTAGSYEFIGVSWEDGGIVVNEDGEPKADSRGNTVLGHSVRDLEADDFYMVMEAYTDDCWSKIDLEHLQSHLSDELGLNEDLGDEFMDKVKEGKWEAMADERAEVFEAVQKYNAWIETMIDPQSQADLWKLAYSEDEDGCKAHVGDAAGEWTEDLPGVDIDDLIETERQEVFDQIDNGELDSKKN